jgi:hypothetical protein
MGYFNIDTLSKNKSVFNPRTSLESTSSYGIWDLTKSSVSYSNTRVEIDTLFIVTEYYQMRPDLIAAIKLGDHSLVGSLLKINNISNPFAVKEGNILTIPTLSTVESTFNNKKALNQAQASSNTNTNPNQVFRENQEQKKFKVSEGRKKFLESKIKNQPSMILPPNVAQPNDRSIAKKDGFLIFAPNAGGGGFNRPVN